MSKVARNPGGPGTGPPDPQTINHAGGAVLHYTAMRLKRYGDLRQDPEWLQGQRASDHSLVLPLWMDKNLFRILGQPPAPALLQGPDAAQFLASAVEVIYLGHDGERAVFAADLAEQDRGHVKDLIEQSAPGCRFIDLRRVSAVVTPEQASLLAYARVLASWHRNNGFCARCGHRTQPLRGGHMRHCGQCGREHFPRIDPAVIMLVEQPDPDGGQPRCLLGRHTRLPGRVYSTLAGYVDPGETLEQAVAREVWEEARIRVTDIRYVASQPWPFAGSLMLGFRAVSMDAEPDISQDELEDARWFTAAEMRDFGEFEDGNGAEFELPRRDSIARLLIEQWMADSG